jgi:competence protein ComEC
MALRSEKREFTLHPLLWLAIAFSAGIAIAGFFELPTYISAIPVVIFASFSIATRMESVSTYFVIASFLALGFGCFQFEQAGVAENRIRRLFDAGNLVSGEPLEIEGELRGAPEPLPDGYFIVLQSEQAVARGAAIEVTGRVRIFVPLQNEQAKEDFSNLELSHGSRIRVACLLEREDKYLNPGVQSRKFLLDRQRIDATANLKSPLLIEKISQGRGADRTLETIFELRVATIQKFREMFSPQTSGVLIASMLGNKYFLDKNTGDVFREGGTFHVLVISGLHITFIGGLILLAVRRFTKRRWAQAAVTLCLLWSYGIAVGGDVPVIRACVMFTILMIGYAEFRTSNLLNSFGASVLLLLTWRPSDLFDPSFQLTFTSVAAIVAIGLPLLSKLKSIGSWMPTADQPFPPTVPKKLRRFCETVYWNEDVWNIHRERQIWNAEIVKSPYLARLGDYGLRPTAVFVFEAVFISTAVQICLLPLLVYYFHRFPLLSIPMNLWVGGVLAAESISAAIAVPVAVASETLAMPFIAMAEFFNWLIVTLSSFMTEWFMTGARFPIYSGTMRGIYLAYFVPLIISAISAMRWDPFSSRTRRSLSGKWLLFGSFALLALIGITILLHPFSAPVGDAKLHFDFLDVGQGDSALVTFPNGKTMLIDAGGTVDYRNDEDGTFEPDVPRIGEVVVSEFLWERGISHIDMIVATHADADHIQGLSDVVSNFTVGSAFFGHANDDSELSPLLAEIERHSVEASIIKVGGTLEIEGVKVEVLNPVHDIGTANNGSVVLKFVFGETSFLLTGDIERGAELAMLGSGTDLNTDVIKVPHHGSRTSSTEQFVKSVMPRYAVISVGRRSIFGHPPKEVVERWKAVGAEVMTTGERGMISFTSDGKELSVGRFVSP